jgi:hypothetical protein
LEDVEVVVESKAMIPRLMPSQKYRRPSFRGRFTISHPDSPQSLEREFARSSESSHSEVWKKATKSHASLSIDFTLTRWSIIGEESIIEHASVT